MMTGSIAGIDVHKRVLMVAVGIVSDAAQPESLRLESRRFGTTTPQVAKETGQ